MPNDPSSKLPLPVEVIDFAFLSSPAAPAHAVLEFQTASNPVRLFLTKVQLELLGLKANKAAATLESL